FEIDPLMVSISSNTDNFTYLDTCQPKPPDIVIGDARLTLGREPDGAFDLIIVDAFTSDAVPIHLMTAEALRIYLAKTGPKGIAVLHISNRYLDLDSVLGATVQLVPGAHGLLITDDDADGSYGQTSSTVAVFAKSAEALAPFQGQKGVKDLEAKGLRAWTDDYSDVLGPFLSKMWD
ncbi:MAG: fused MFS/spermidine synthase, partial [Hyphomicrobiaceae bacterium]